MLRGPQTAAELRANCERLHRFADISSVEGFLDELADASRRPRAGRQAAARAGRARGALGASAVRRPVRRASALPVAADAADCVAAERTGRAEAQQGALPAELAELRALVERLDAELGVDAA